MIFSGLLRHVFTHIPRNDGLLECFLATSNSWGYIRLRGALAPWQSSVLCTGFTRLLRLKPRNDVGVWGLAQAMTTGTSFCSRPLA